MSKQQEKIGRYAVRSELGRGSMGVVHLAHDPLMDRELAIKTILLPCGLAEERKERFRERFLFEAQAAGKLSHPGIVTIYDFNEEPGEEPPFIAMEYVEGPTLHELVCDEGALSPDWALNMAETLADALRVAHESGVVHRDIKPANILVREVDGAPKIADFGVARLRASDRNGSEYTYGSPAYMAPECVRGEASDERSDLFSLAVILYEALTGHRPFEGEGYDTIRQAIVNDPPTPIRQYAPELSPSFERFFDRALAKARSERIASGAEFCEALQEIREAQRVFGGGAETVITTSDEPETDGAPTSRSPLRWGWVSAAAVLVLLAFTVGRGLRETSPTGTPPPRPARVTQAPARPAPMLVSALGGEEFSRVETSRPIAETPPPEPEANEIDAVAPEPVVEAPAPRPVTPAPAPKTTAPPAVQRPLPIQPAPEPLEVVDFPSVVPTAPAPAQLELSVKSSLKSGTLTLLVDGDEVYFTELASTETGKMSRVFKKAVGKATEELDTRIEIPAGPHTIVARVFNEAKSRELVEQVEIDVEPGQAQTLRVVTGGRFGRRLDIELD